ncbi:MAG TPA: gliding motility lipoprotein GldD [Bacteroidales bacterium]|nr:gliding motility lipoprotein GldD [Bacteroidales bacterium]
MKNKYWFIVLLFYACNSNYSPKPMEYFRIDFPKKEYQLFDSLCPYTFQYPVYGRITKGLGEQEQNPCWINIEFPAFKATMYISYFDLNNNLPKLLEDCRSLAYKHDIKADAIHEILYNDFEHHLFGMVYEIKGNAASPLQFYLTDSTHHFLRGSLYFDVKPNKDSLAPVIDFLQKDAKHLIETLRWK